MQLAILGLAVISLVISVVAVMRQEPLNWRFAVPAQIAVTDAAMFETVFDYTVSTGQAHAPGIIVEKNGFSLVWFQGSEEAQADVDVFASQFARRGGEWIASTPAPRVTRGNLGDAFEPQQLVVTLGNAIENQAVPGALFATVVSVGGWAMASIADVRMGDAGPVKARKLNLSPLLNRSHLVKSPMVEYADGSFALPAYFEMGSTYGTLVRLDSGGRVVDTRRMSGRGVKPIQPMVVPLNATRAVAFLRDFDPSGHLWICRTDDGGQSWSEVVQTDIPNPSSPVAALSLGGQRLLMAMNDDPDNAHELRLSVSDDGGLHWRVIHTLEDDSGAARYPMLRRLHTGEILLTYSHSTKRGIRAHLFNDAWVADQ